MSPPDELQLWCKVVGINKGKVYGLGSKSINTIGRQLYQDCTSSVQVMKEEFEQLKNKLLVVETKRDELRERQIEKNNKQIEHVNTQFRLEK